MSLMTTVLRTTSATEISAYSDGLLDSLAVSGRFLQSSATSALETVELTIVRSLTCYERIRLLPNLVGYNAWTSLL